MTYTGPTVAETMDYETGSEDKERTDAMESMDDKENDEKTHDTDSAKSTAKSDGTVEDCDVYYYEDEPWLFLDEDLDKGIVDIFKDWFQENEEWSELIDDEDDDGTEDEMGENEYGMNNDEETSRDDTESDDDKISADSDEEGEESNTDSDDKTGSSMSTKSTDSFTDKTIGEKKCVKKRPVPLHPDLYNICNKLYMAWQCLESNSILLNASISEPVKSSIYMVMQAVKQKCNGSLLHLVCLCLMSFATQSLIASLSVQAFREFSICALTTLLRPLAALSHKLYGNTVHD